MKTLKTVAALLSLALLLTACNAPKETPETTTPATQQQPAISIPTPPTYETVTDIQLHDNGITVDGAPVSEDTATGIYTANDIVYYESGKDFTYGEGSEQDAHTPEEAAAHTVVHITKPGAYSLSGKLSLGQIAVDLGDDAEKDPEAVVTLILNGVDITCQVAPAVIFYNVYECGDDDAEKATKDVDTSAAGANVIIADGTENAVKGSYVAKIYKPDTVRLNEAKTEVADAKKLHKYDGAFYSKCSMNIFGGGILNIHAENEGLDSELHLTVNGGDIRIKSGNDGINTNEDGVSVTTVNGGSVAILVTGETGEGDGIDSNGWLVINGGTVVAQACSRSADAGIDSDMGIHIRGGTVIATGHMLDRIEDGGQNYAVFAFAEEQSDKRILLKDENGKGVVEFRPENDYSILLYSSPTLKEGSYTLWSGEQQLAGSAGGMKGEPGMKPGGEGRPERPEDFAPPEDFVPPQDGNQPQRPQNDKLPQKPEGNRPENFGGNDMGTREATPDFLIRNGGNMFGSVAPYNP